MAIDTLRKRASIASLGLAFLGPSVIPDGSFAQADRQVIANSYYGIEASGAFVQVGATSQLEAITSTGGITLERAIGGTSQLAALTASGGITLERVIGGTSQLAAFSSTGGITIISPVTAPNIDGMEYTLPNSIMSYTMPNNLLEYTLPDNLLGYTLKDKDI